MDRLMDLWIVLAALFLLWGCKPVHPFSSLYGDALSAENCLPLRGFCAVMVALHHISQQTEAGQFFRIFLYISSFLVAAFFFLSGYGLMRQTMRDPDYGRGFLRRRLPPIAAMWLFSLLLFWLVHLTNGEHISLTGIFALTFKGDPFLVILWYVPVILGAYLAFGLLLHVFAGKKERILLGMALLWLVYAAAGLALGIGQWWFDSCHLLPVGMGWALYEENIQKRLERGRPYWFAMAVSALGFALLFQFFDPIFALWPTAWMRYAISAVRSLCFTLALVLASMKLRFRNAVSVWLGKISFEFYLLHGVLLLLFHGTLIPIQSDFLYAACVLAFGALLAAAVHIPYQRLNRRYRSFLQSRGL